MQAPQRKPEPVPFLTLCRRLALAALAICVCWTAVVGVVAFMAAAVRAGVWLVGLL